MGNNSNVREIVIGEILLNYDAESASFSYSIPDSSPLQLIVHDKLGRAMITSKLFLDSSSGSLDFSVRSLETGDYHAWMYIGEDVFVRHFRLEKNNEIGFFDKLLSVFK